LIDGQQDKRFFSYLKVQAGSGDHPWGVGGHYLLQKSGRGIKLITNLHLNTKVKIERSCKSNPRSCLRVVHRDKWIHLITFDIK
jgi:hypothetical protein